MKRLAVVFLIAVLTVFSGSNAGARNLSDEKTNVGTGFGLTDEEVFVIAAQARVFTEIMNLYATRALEKPEDLALCGREMFAMRRSDKCRDKFSKFFDPEETAYNRDVYRGEYGGVGIGMEDKDGKVVVVSVVSGAPADRAGIKPGDVLVAVDGKVVKVSLDVVKAIRGKKLGSRVAVEIMRGNVSEPIKFILVTEKTVLETVKTAPVPGRENVVIIRLSGFVENTPQILEKEILTAKSRGIEKFVFDLRKNPGGLLDPTLEALAMFMKDNDVVVAVKYRTTEKSYGADFLKNEFGVGEIGKFRGLKAVILVDGNTASAAEIFSGALQDWGYKVVGETTFGKGVGQQMFALSDGSSLTLTTFEFLIGNKRTAIRNKGVIPDVAVKQPKDAAEDLQLKKAVEVLDKIK